MNLPEGFEAMSPVQQALTVARHELVTLHGLVAVDAAAPDESFSIDTNEAVAMIDKVLKRIGNRSNREVLRDCLMDFVKRVSRTGRDFKTPEEVQILPGVVELLTGVFHL